MRKEEAFFFLDRQEISSGAEWKGLLCNYRKSNVRNMNIVMFVFSFTGMSWVYAVNFSTSQLKVDIRQAKYIQDVNKVLQRNH